MFSAKITKKLGINKILISPTTITTIRTVASIVGVENYNSLLANINKDADLYEIHLKEKNSKVGSISLEEIKETVSILSNSLSNVAFYTFTPINLERHLNDMPNLKFHSPLKTRIDPIIAKKFGREKPSDFWFYLIEVNKKDL